MLVCPGPSRMTKPYVLLHCPSARPSAARVEAWEGRDPGDIRVLLSSPRCEIRLLRYLELLGVGGGRDEEVAKASRMDRWIA